MKKSISYVILTVAIVFGYLVYIDTFDTEAIVMISCLIIIQALEYQNVYNINIELNKEKEKYQCIKRENEALRRTIQGLKDSKDSNRLRRILDKINFARSIDWIINEIGEII